VAAIQKERESSNSKTLNFQSNASNLPRKDQETKVKTEVKLEHSKVRQSQIFDKSEATMGSHLVSQSSPVKAT